MKKITNTNNPLAKDIQGEGFTKRESIIYGIIAPAALVAACVLAELLAHL